MNSLVELVIAALAGFLAGLFVGQCISFRRVHVGTHNKLRPELERHPLGGALTGRVFRIVLVVLFLISTAMIVQFTVTQRNCNDRLWDTIATRAGISEDTETARKENDEAVHTLFAKWIELSQVPPEKRGDSALTALRTFETTYAANVAEQQENARKRAATPYPRC